MQRKLFAWVSWIVFLVSAVAEWGFDIDFPLTLLAWLAIAAVVLFAAILQVEVNRGPSLGRFTKPPVFSRSPYPTGSGGTRSRADDSSQSDFLSALDLSGGFRIPMISEGGIVHEALAMMDATVLRPETERGPPSGGNQVRLHWTAHRADRPGAGTSPTLLPVTPLLVHHEPAMHFQTAQIKANDSRSTACGWCRETDAEELWVKR